MRGVCGGFLWCDRQAEDTPQRWTKNDTHFFSRFPAPESRKPLANGLWSILSWVI